MTGQARIGQHKTQPEPGNILGWRLIWVSIFWSFFPEPESWEAVNVNQPQQQHRQEQQAWLTQLDEVPTERTGRMARGYRW